jgi:hypothetical protein
MAVEMMLSVLVYFRRLLKSEEPYLHISTTALVVS